MSAHGITSTSEDEQFQGRVLESLRTRLEDDGRILTFEEWEDHKERFEGAKARGGLELNRERMIAVVNLAVSTLQGLYVHMDLKRTRRGVDPIRPLRILMERLESGEKIRPESFHNKMLEIFKSLGDVHTAYRLPEPYRRAIAFLPFILNRYSDDGRSRYVVTRTLWDEWDEKSRHAAFAHGTEVSHWNGTPIEQAVRRSTDFEEGSNPENDLALGLQFMTVRWLGASFEPDSPWVIIGYRDKDNQKCETRFFWSVLESNTVPRLTNQARKLLFTRETRRREGARAVNTESEFVHRERMKLFVPKQVSPGPSFADLGRSLTIAFGGLVNRQQMETFTNREGLAAKGAVVPSILPMFFEAWQHSGAELLKYGARLIENRYFEVKPERRDAIKGKNFGYIGIRAFPLEGPERALFTYEFRRLLNLMPGDGLILDVRDNPGGSANNAEESLQFLTPKEITPLPFRFLASGTTRKLTARNAEFKEYRESIDDALLTGAAFSAGRPLTAPAAANALGQHYFGPVLLVTNAVTYSAGDIFAAGFQDNGIGSILGVDGTTGAGGANCWFYRENIQRAIETDPLPDEMNMQIAVRQCYRVGSDNLGVSIEEIGIKTKETLRYSLTKEDVLGDNRRPWGLLLRAATELCDKKSYDLQIASFRSQPTAAGEVRHLKVLSKNIRRLDFYVNGRPSTQDVARIEAGDSDFAVSLPTNKRVEVRIQGYSDKDELVARVTRVFHG